MNLMNKKKLFLSKFYKLFKNNHNSFRTLMYHSIFDERKTITEKNLWSLSLSLFKDQITEIEKYQKIFSTNVLVRDCPQKGIALTFDDGYVDTYEIAAQHLIEKKIPFTVFIITNFVKNNKKGYMTEAMIKELSENELVTIGSHSMNHLKLTELNDDLVRNEITRSKLYLEDLTSQEITSLSYPHGKYNNKIKAIVHDVGYKLAFSSNFNCNKKNENKFSLSRTEIWNSDSLEIFNQKLLGNWDWMQYRLI